MFCAAVGVAQLFFARQQTFAAVSHARAVAQNNGHPEAGLAAVADDGCLTTWESGRFTSTKTVSFMGLDKEVRSSLTWNQ
jgi:hypothetical protein